MMDKTQNKRDYKNLHGQVAEPIWNHGRGFICHFSENGNGLRERKKCVPEQYPSQHIFLWMRFWLHHHLTQPWLRRTQRKQNTHEHYFSLLSMSSQLTFLYFYRAENEIVHNDNLYCVIISFHPLSFISQVQITALVLSFGWRFAFFQFEAGVERNEGEWMWHRTGYFLTGEGLQLIKTKPGARTWKNGDFYSIEMVWVWKVWRMGKTFLSNSAKYRHHWKFTQRFKITGKKQSCFKYVIQNGISLCMC